MSNVTSVNLQANRNVIRVGNDDFVSKAKGAAKFIVGGLCLSLVSYCAFKALGMAAAANVGLVFGVSLAAFGALSGTAALTIFLWSACVNQRLFSSCPRS